MKGAIDLDSGCICIQLRRTANAVTAFYDQALKPVGISVNQFSLLSHLKQIEPCNVKQLAEEVQLERTTMTRALRPLYKAGYIKDLAEPGSRGHQFAITEAGNRVLAAALPLWSQAQELIQTTLGKDHLGQLFHTLEQLQKLAQS